MTYATMQQAISEQVVELAIKISKERVISLGAAEKLILNAISSKLKANKNNGIIERMMER